jgi:rhamnosyltransferase
MTDQSTAQSNPIAPSSRSALAAVIVAYRPRAAQIQKLVAALAEESNYIYVMDNGGGLDAISDCIDKYSMVRVVDMGGNRGIGAALNLGFRLAKAAGVDYVVTFDQDSQPAAHLASSLMKAFDDLSSDGMKVGAVGPRLVDARCAPARDYPYMRTSSNWPAAVYCGPTSKYLEADFLITSGCLTSLAVFEIVGEFDQELFIDCVDLEWCFRAGFMSYRFFGVCTAIMPHSLGTGDSSSTLGLSLTAHNPVRRYYYARNTVRLLRLRHVSLGWKARMLAGLVGRLLLFPFVMRFAKGWTSHWLMLTRGVADGVAGVVGACRFSS